MSQFPVDSSDVRVIEHTNSPSPRAALIAQSLKGIARRARTPRSVWVSVGGGAQRRWQHIFIWAVLASFALIVLLPNLVAGTYLAFMASDQYASETRFAVRGGEPAALSALGGLVGTPSAQRVQDSLILSDYIQGRGMMEAVNGALNLRQMFSSEKIDFLSRFDPGESNEDLLRYWRRHVDAHIDSASGILTVVVRAFTPQDSLNITDKIVSESEALVNDLTQRSRRDALRQAKDELQRANENLQGKIVAMRDARNAEGILDSGKTSEVMTKMLGDLRLELAHLEQDYGAQRRTVLPSSPQLRVLEARIGSMKDQIRQLESTMTGSGASATPALADAMSRLDRAKLEKNIAEKQYVAAVGAFERARIDLESQQVYLATFLKPVLAQEALYPKRFWLWSIVAFLSLLLWGGGVGIAVLVRNHVAI
jgi:capsular polysaccharide transport system permease protein